MPLANLITINKIITPWNIISTLRINQNSYTNLSTCPRICTVLINTGEHGVIILPLPPPPPRKNPAINLQPNSYLSRTTSVKFSTNPSIRDTAWTVPPSSPLPRPDLFHLLSNQRHDPFFDLRHSAGIRNGQYVLRFLLPRKNVILSARDEFQTK